MHRQYERIITLTGIVLMLLVITTPAAAESSAAPKPPPQVPFFGMNTYFSGNERAENDGEDGIADLLSLGRALSDRSARITVGEAPMYVRQR